MFLTWNSTESFWKALLSLKTHLSYDLVIPLFSIPWKNEGICPQEDDVRMFIRALFIIDKAGNKPNVCFNRKMDK